MGMRTFKIINKTKNTELAQKAEIADTPFQRMKGLLGRSGLEKGEALIITSCSSIHTFFMKFVIDAVFLDKQNKVVSLANSLKKWRLFSSNFKGKTVIELPEGTIKNTLTEVGNLVDFCEK